MRTTSNTTARRNFASKHADTIIARVRGGLSRVAGVLPVQDQAEFLEWAKRTVAAKQKSR